MPATAPPTEDAAPQGLVGVRRRRARHMLSAGGSLLALIGLGWTVFFALQGNFLLVGFEFALMLLGLAVVVLAHRQRHRLAAWLLFAALFVTLWGFSLWLDIPTPAAPRSSHIFLLSLGVCAYYVFQSEKAWVRNTVVGLFLFSFLFLASSPFALPGPYAIPDSVRVGGTWINTACALLTLVMVLHLMDTDVNARGGLHVAMRDALAARRFSLSFQPQVDSTGRVVGAEALLRWRDHVRGNISPGVFIPLAEQTGFILPLGQWALEAACDQLARWQARTETRHLTLSVNVSAQQVRQPDFVALVLAAIQRSGAPAGQLKLELTESMLIHDIDDLIQKMQALSARGVGFSLDDFGTGFSSLSYLKRLPLHQLKIDQSFVNDVMNDANAAAITRTLLSLGQSLQLTVIAEGVETEAQRDFLLQQGCLVFQGYLFSRPLSIQAFESYLISGPAAAGIQSANGPVQMLRNGSISPDTPG